MKEFLFYNLGVFEGLCGFKDTSTAYAESLVRMYNYVSFFLVIVILLVFYLMVQIIILFSYKNDSVNNFYEEHGRTAYLSVYDLAEYKVLELAWCAFPTLVLAFIVWPSFSLLYSLDPALDPLITVKVIGHQWYWSYEVDYFVERNEGEVDHNYLHFDSVMVQEDDLEKGGHRLYEVDNRLLLPLGVPLRFVVTSSDVLHSWALPSLGIKVDAVPGRLNQFITIIKRPGIFYGQCSELCGPMHAFMPIVLHAIPFEEFCNYVDHSYEREILINKE